MTHAKKAFPWVILGALVLSVIIVATVCILLVMGRAVPGELYTFAGLCLSFFLGGRLGQQSVTGRVTDLAGGG